MTYPEHLPPGPGDEREPYEPPTVESIQLSDDAAEALT